MAVTVRLNLKNETRSAFHAITKFCADGRKRAPRLEFSREDAEAEIKNNAELSLAIRYSKQFPASRRDELIELLQTINSGIREFRTRADEAIASPDKVGTIDRHISREWQRAQ